MDISKNQYRSTGGYATASSSTPPNISTTISSSHNGLGSFLNEMAYFSFVFTRYFSKLSN